MRKIENFDPQQIGELRDAAFSSETRGTRDELYTYAQHADDAAKLAVRRAQLWKAADDAEKDGTLKHICDLLTLRQQVMYKKRS